MPRRYYPRQDAWEVFTMAVTVVLTVMYWSFYTQIISGMKWSSFRSFQQLVNNGQHFPQTGHFLGTDGHQKVFSHRLRHTARHTNYSMYNVPQLGY